MGDPTTSELKVDKPITITVEPTGELTVRPTSATLDKDQTIQWSMKGAASFVITFRDGEVVVVKERGLIAAGGTVITGDDGVTKVYTANKRGIHHYQVVVCLAEEADPRKHHIVCDLSCPSVIIR